MPAFFISGIPQWRSPARDARSRLDRIAEPGSDPLLDAEMGKHDGDARRHPDREARFLREAVPHQGNGATQWNCEVRVQDTNHLDREDPLVTDAAFHALPGTRAPRQVMMRQQVVQPLDLDIKRKCNHTNVIRPLAQIILLDEDNDR